MGVVNFDRIRRSNRGKEEGVKRWQLCKRQGFKFRFDTIIRPYRSEERRWQIPDEKCRILTTLQKKQISTLLKLRSVFVFENYLQTLIEYIINYKFVFANRQSAA